MGGKYFAQMASRAVFWVNLRLSHKHLSSGETQVEVCVYQSVTGHQGHQTGHPHKWSPDYGLLELGSNLVFHVAGSFLGLVLSGHCLVAFFFIMGSLLACGQACSMLVLRVQRPSSIDNSISGIQFIILAQSLASQKRSFSLIILQTDCRVNCESWSQRWLSRMRGPTCPNICCWAFNGACL